MNIPKAIKELEEPNWLVTTNHTPEYSEAIQLGIEALKRVSWLRDIHSQIGTSKLVGETKD